MMYGGFVFHLIILISFQPIEDLEDDEVRLALLQREREKIERGMMDKMVTQEKGQQQHSGGARPKSKKYT